MNTLQADLRLALTKSGGRVEGDPTARHLRDSGIACVSLFIPKTVAEEYRQMLHEFLSQHLASVDNAVTDEAKGMMRIPTDVGATITVRQSNDGRAAYDTGMIDIFDIDAAIPELAEIDLSRVRRAISLAADGRAELEGVHAYVNSSVIDTRQFHSDNVDLGHYKAFLYLSDVSLADGPYSYITGSHKPSLWRYANILLNALARRPLTDMRHPHYSTSSSRVFLGEGVPGTLLISNQRGFHRGIPQEPGRRRSLVMFKYRVHA